MKEIKHFMLPNQTNDLYTKEAISSITLTQLVADKINELVDGYNVVTSNYLEKELEQDGRIAKGILYMKDNLSNSISDLLDTMVASGEIDTIIENSLNRVESKIDKQEVYFDDITCEKLHDAESDTDYYLTRIPGKYKLELGVANDDIDGNTLESTIEFSHRKNATVCINGGVYDVKNFTPVGTLIKDYKVIHEATPSEDKYQFLTFNESGDYKIYDRLTSTKTMLDKGVKNCLCIFGSLIEFGNPIPQTDERDEPRQSIGFTKDKDIIVITCDGRTLDNPGMSYDDLVRLHTMYGSYNAYILDGGGSASTVLRGVKQNDNIDYATVDRKVNNFLYVVKENDVNSLNNPNNLIGDVKQELLEIIINKLDFEKGYIRIRGPENFYAPGIEMYVNNETSRRSKLGLTFDKENIRNTYLYWGLKAGESEKNNLFRIYDTGVWVQTYHGPSSSRPNGVVGLCYFDESLGKPLWFNGSKWVDATGTEV